MSVRLLSTLVLLAGVLAGIVAGTFAQQLLALAVAAVVVAQHTLVVHTERHPATR